MDPVTVESVAVRPRPMVVAALGVAATGGAIAFLLYWLEVSGLSPWSIPLAFFGGLHVAGVAAWVLFSHLQSGLYARHVRGVSHVDASGIVHHADGATFGTPRSAMRDGIYRAGRLRLLGPMRRLLFEAKMDADSAQAALRALGLDAASHRAEFRAAAPVFATLPRQMAFLGALAFLFNILPWAWSFGVPLLCAALLLLGGWPARLTAGTDGFLLRWLWWTRFVPIKDVIAIGTDADRDVTLTLASGKKLVWYTSARSKATTADQRDHRDAVVARMREAHALAHARPRAAHLADTMGRGGRSHAEWLHALRQLRAPADDYRAAALPPDDLWQLLEDPAAPEDARAGAAYVLRAAATSENDERRLRNAAGATVSPRLRIALDSAAEGNEEELAAALEEMDLGPPSLARRPR